MKPSPPRVVDVKRIKFSTLIRIAISDWFFQRGFAIAPQGFAKLRFAKAYSAYVDETNHDHVVPCGHCRDVISETGTWHPNAGPVHIRCWHKLEG